MPLPCTPGADKQQFQFAMIAFYADDRTADTLTVEQNAVGLGVRSVNRGLDGGARDDFTIFFKMVVAEAKFFGGSVLERLLVV